MERERKVSWKRGSRKVELTLGEATDFLLDCMSADTRANMDLMDFVVRHDLEGIPDKKTALDYLKALHEK